MEELDVVVISIVTDLYLIKWTLGITFHQQDQSLCDVYLKPSLTCGSVSQFFFSVLFVYIDSPRACVMPWEFREERKPLV